MCKRKLKQYCSKNEEFVLTNTTKTHPLRRCSPSLNIKNSEKWIVDFLSKIFKIVLFEMPSELNLGIRFTKIALRFLKKSVCFSN